MTEGGSVEQCAATTRSGGRCRRPSVDGSKACAQHSRLRVIEGGGPTSSTVLGAAGMSRRSLLTALRDKIAADIDEGVPARDLASLSKRLLDISSELDAVSQAEDGDGITDAAATPDERWVG